MNWKVDYRKHTLRFKFPAGTSRGILREKEIFIIKVENDTGHFGLGESAPLKGLSPDDIPEFESHLAQACANLQKETVDFDSEESIYEWLFENIPARFPSLRFGMETALLDLRYGAQRCIQPSDFSANSRGIPINGLIWMGKKEFMRHQIDEKLEAGFNCIKIKIGALDFDSECALLDYIREYYTPEQISIRVDANGAFTPAEAEEKLRHLAAYGLHSIEQPIRQGQWEAMRSLCAVAPLPIALDEELIGIYSLQEKIQLLEKVVPQYIILKPTLLGGLRASKEWITLAEERNIGWWITSALESNIGLNAIAQFTATLDSKVHQGLGTGQLYHNNIPSPLTIEQGHLFYGNSEMWEFPL